MAAFYISQDPCNSLQAQWALLWIINLFEINYYRLPILNISWYDYHYAINSVLPPVIFNHSVYMQFLHFVHFIFKTCTLPTIYTRSSTYRRCHSNISLTCLNAFITATNSSGLSTDPWCIPSVTSVRSLFQLKTVFFLSFMLMSYGKLRCLLRILHITSVLNLSLVDAVVSLQISKLFIPDCILLIIFVFRLPSGLFTVTCFHPMIFLIAINPRVSSC